MKTLTPWITTPHLNSTPKALQVRMAIFLLSILSYSFRRPPSHINRGVKPAPTRPKLDMWHLELTLGHLPEASLQRGRLVDGPTGRPTTMVGWPVGPAPGHRLRLVSFLQASHCIATCLSFCNIGLVPWWALQSMWFLHGDMWLDGVFAPWIKGYNFPLFSAKIVHSQIATRTSGIRWFLATWV